MVEKDLMDIQCCGIRIILGSLPGGRKKVNPFTPKSDRFQISLVASPEI